MGFKVVIGTKSGKCVQKEVADADTKPWLGKKIGEKVKGELLGLTGYEFEISGGSDYCGFPMRKDVPGFSRKRILAVSGIGLKKEANGIRQKKTVCGNTIQPKTVQINLKILTEGKEPLVVEAPKAEEKAAA